MQAVPKEDLYAQLGISPDASAEDIRRAYRTKAFELHPDRNKAPDAAERFHQVNLAYEVLSDARRRATYDASRAVVEPTRILDDIVSELFTLRPMTAGDATADGCPHCGGIGEIVLDVGLVKIKRSCPCSL